MVTRPYTVDDVKVIRVGDAALVDARRLDRTCLERQMFEQQRDELTIALRVYLDAGDKESRRAASVIAKAALVKVTP